jgi:hypothetical protein
VVVADGTTRSPPGTVFTLIRGRVTPRTNGTDALDPGEPYYTARTLPNGDPCTYEVGESTARKYEVGESTARKSTDPRRSTESGTTSTSDPRRLTPPFRLQPRHTCRTTSARSRS